MLLFLLIRFRVFAFLCCCVFRNTSSSNPCHEICACYICSCTCNASFRRDQFQTIHTTKHFELTNNRAAKKNSSSFHTDTAPTQHHKVIQELTQAITDHAKDAIVEVIQQGSPIKKFDWRTQSQDSVGEDQLELQRAIERSLGVTAISMAKDPMISGNILLKNSLREEMGGVPCTQLSATQETVSQYRNRRQNRRNRGNKKCSRTSRNDLVDLCSSDEEEEKKKAIYRKDKMKKRIVLKLMKMCREEVDSSEKEKIKYAMRALHEKEENKKNEMIKYILDVHTTEMNSFDSNDAAINILEFADDVE